MEKNNLTSEEYWNKQYVSEIKGNIYRINPFVNLAVAELDSVFKRILPKNNAHTFIEIGCAPGIWMEYFHREFDYQVDGIEYTKNGYEKTLKNLKAYGIQSTVYHQDFLNNNIEKRYNVVFSGGFIEHFEDPYEVIKKHVELLVSNGIVILEIPNFSGMNGWFQRHLNKEIYEKHNVGIMNLEYFQSVSDTLNLEVLYLGYVGKINFSLFQGNTFVIILLALVQKFLTAIYLILGKRLPIDNSKSHSPYIVAILKKKTVEV